MPKQYFNQDYLVPVKGINTEASPLSFPEGYCLDALNVELQYDPLRISPRKGLELLAGFLIVNDYSKTNGVDAIVTGLWEGVNEDPELDFLVVQAANKLSFYDATQTNPLNHPKGTFDLVDYAAGAKTITEIRVEEVSFTPVKGTLVVVANSIEPLLFTFDGTDVSVTQIKIKIRDVIGVDDGLYISERPATLSEEHEYNLENQGWYEDLHTGGGTEQNPITHFNTEVGAYPSNADNVAVGIVEGVDTDAGRRVFKPKYLKDYELGNSPTPRGHYIVDPFNIDRQGILDGLISGDDRTGGSSSGGGLPNSPTNPRDPNDDYPYDPNFPDFIEP